MGGVVAFEMARQLEAAGEPVALVALLDSRAPGLLGTTAPAAQLSLLKQFATDLAARAGISATVFEPIWSAPGSDRDERLLEAAIAHGVLPPDVDTQHLRNLLNVFVVNLHAERGYTPSAARVELTLIQSAQTAAARATEPTVGWSVLTDRGVRRYTTPGTHYSMMRRPHVETLARRLAAALAGEVEADEQPHVTSHAATPSA
jgi:thioesterase domain-containing protein